MGPGARASVSCSFTCNCAHSASGYACLVSTLARLFNVEGTGPIATVAVQRAEDRCAGDVSDVARLGSGSACRSMYGVLGLAVALWSLNMGASYGGFVKWEMGQAADGSDSRAVQVVPETHWPEMRVLVAVVSDKKKTVSSTVRPRPQAPRPR